MIRALQYMQLQPNQAMETVEVNKGFILILKRSAEAVYLPNKLHFILLRDTTRVYSV